MKPQLRILYLTGTILIVLSFAYLFVFPYELFEDYPGMTLIIAIDWLVSFSLGITEIVVAWLYERT